MLPLSHTRHAKPKPKGRGTAPVQAETDWGITEVRGALLGRFRVSGPDVRPAPQGVGWMSRQCAEAARYPSRGSGALCRNVFL